MKSDSRGEGKEEKIGVENRREERKKKRGEENTREERKVSMRVSVYSEHNIQRGKHDNRSTQPSSLSSAL
jgi:hypothetical protein